MTEIMPVPRNSHITVLRPPSIVWGVIFLNLVGMWLTRGSDYDYLMALLNIGGIALVVLATWIGKNRHDRNHRDDHL